MKMKWSTVPLVVFFTCIALVLDFAVAPNVVNYHSETTTNVLFSANNRVAGVWFQVNYSMDQVVSLTDGFVRYYQAQKAQVNITSSWSWNSQLCWWITVSETYSYATANWVVFWLFVALNICMVITDIIVIVEVILEVDSRF